MAESSILHSLLNFSQQSRLYPGSFFDFSIFENNINHVSKSSLEMAKSLNFNT